VPKPGWLYALESERIVWRRRHPVRNKTEQMRRLAFGSARCERLVNPLMREWIHAMLYDSRDGYFAKEAPVAPLSSAIDVNTLAGREEYLERVASEYRILGTKWLTPSEIFSPWFGVALASHIRRTGVRRIMEIGSGSGTLAMDIITHLKASGYGSEFSFTSIEISEALAETQRRRLREAGHGDVYVSRVADATKDDTWIGDGDAQVPTLILGMEVLDNLPHDKVVQVDGVWHQTRVAVDGGALREVLEPLTDDALICSTLDAYESIQGERTRDSVLKWVFEMTGTPDPVWLPTGAQSLLNAIRHVPNHELLLADFDFLPNVVIAGENAPIVSSTVDGKAVDRGELLGGTPFGSVDVFFPTDFRLLSAMYRSTQPTGKVCVEKAGSFLQGALPEGEHARIRCRDGTAPLLEDYENTSFARFSTL